MMNVKKICGIFMVVILFFTITVSESFAKTNNEDDLTTEEIIEKLEEIDTKYEVGDRLSDDDAEFIKEYAKMDVVYEATEIQPLGGNSFIRTGQNNSGSVRARAAGTVGSSHGIINNSYYANFTTSITTGGYLVNSIRNSVSHSAYGAIGSGGIGKVFSGSKGTTCVTNTCESNLKESYSASVAYSSTIARATINWSSGSFTITD
ncbi:hypothetical protein [Alteribacter populi]|uniref:hypothetical protein n=1 Tax=Alteribacter populi TaxID=2011011 RepID=UPI000BBAB1CF|nr:hypothetical protein [Alteribacter populi]